MNQDIGEEGEAGKVVIDPIIAIPQPLAGGSPKAKPKTNLTPESFLQIKNLVMDILDEKENNLLANSKEVENAIETIIEDITDSLLKKIEK